jgi:hypothetical protein
MPTEGKLLLAWRSKLGNVKESVRLLECTLGIQTLDGETRTAIEKMLRANQDDARLYDAVICKLEHKL